MPTHKKLAFFFHHYNLVTSCLAHPPFDFFCCLDYWYLVSIDCFLLLSSSLPLGSKLCADSILNYFI